MMEQAHTGEGHGDTVLVTGLNHMIVAYGATCLSDVLYAALMGTLYVITEGEEGVAAQRNVRIAGYPGFLLFG